MKKRIILIVIISLVVLGFIICLLVRKDVQSRNELIDLKEDGISGRWKVTEYVVTDNGILVPSYNIAEHFLGRSIVIEKDKIIKSIGYWPEQVDYVTTPYRHVEKQVEDGSAYAVRNGYKDFWYEKFADKMLEVYTFWNSDEAKENGDEFIFTEEGKALCMYLGSYFYMEPYMPAKTNINTEQLYGTWKVERLVSYQDGWKGNNAVLPEARRFEPDTVYLESEGAEFYPLDYYAAAFVLNMDSAVLHMENGTEEQYIINRYESELVDTKTYQKEEGIHDELGLTNEEIQVLDVDVANDSEAMLWDGKIVVVSEEKMIIKLHQGWFLLVKSID